MSQGKTSEAELRLRRLKLLGMTDDDEDYDGDSGGTEIKGNSAAASSAAASSSQHHGGHFHNATHTQNPIKRLQSASGNLSPSRGIVKWVTDFA